MQDPIKNAISHGIFLRSDVSVFCLIFNRSISVYHKRAMCQPSFIHQRNPETFYREECFQLDRKHRQQIVSAAHGRQLRS